MVGSGHLPREVRFIAVTITRIVAMVKILSIRHCENDSIEHTARWPGTSRFEREEERTFNLSCEKAGRQATSKDNQMPLVAIGFYSYCPAVVRFAGFSDATSDGTGADAEGDALPSLATTETAKCTYIILCFAHSIWGRSCCSRILPQMAVKTWTGKTGGHDRASGCRWENVS